MIKTFWAYLLGVLIFWGYSYGVIAIISYFLNKLTTGLSRSAIEENIGLIVFISLAIVILVPSGAILIVKILRKQGKTEILRGILTGLVLFIIYAMINAEISKKAEKKLDMENEALIKKDNEAREQQEKELEETRRQLMKEADSIPSEGFTFSI